MNNLREQQNEKGLPQLKSSKCGVPPVATHEGIERQVPVGASLEPQKLENRSRVDIKVSIDACIT